MRQTCGGKVHQNNYIQIHSLVQELLALQLHWEELCCDCCFHTFFLQRPLSARSRTAPWAWQSPSRCSVVVLWPQLEVQRFILVLCIPYSKQFLLVLVDPIKVNSTKSDLSNVQGPRYTNVSTNTDPKLNTTQLKKAKKPTGLSIVQCKANMGDGEHARICLLVPDVATSAWSPGVKFRPQNYSLLASPLCTLFSLTNC